MDLLDDLLGSSRERGKLASDGGVTVEDVSEDWELEVHPGYNENSVRVTSGVVELYPAAMDSTEKRKFKALTKESKESEGVIERYDLQGPVSQLRDMEKDEIDSICEVFEGSIRPTHLELLRSSLYLQRAAATTSITLPKDIDELKYDLKEDFGHIAYYMNHLVSSGYFNEGGFLQEMYFELLEEVGDDINDRYQEEFELIVEKELIALFVSDDDSAEDVRFGSKAKINGHFRHDPYPEFFDVRGLGDDCAEAIQEGMNLVEEDYDQVLYSELDAGHEEAIRIYPNSVEYLQ